jgi:hypothetical protein
MRLFVSNYVLRMIRIKVHRFHERETQLHTPGNNRGILTKSMI